MSTVSRFGDDTLAIAATAGQVVLAKGGTLGALVVNGAGTTVVVDFYDNKAGDNSGVHLYHWVTATGVGVFPIRIPFKKGLSMIVTAGVIGDAYVVFQ